MAMVRPRISTRVPRVTLAWGRSVTSTPIMSMDTRPMMGQRRPLMNTWAGPEGSREERARGTPSL